MSFATTVGLCLLFVLLGASATLFLVHGLREGRFAHKFPLRRFDGTDNELDYSYRDRDTFGFWLEALAQIAAAMACLVAIFILVFVH